MTALATKSKYTVPQVVSEGSRHLQLLLALGHSNPSMMPHTVSVSSLLHTRTLLTKFSSHQTLPGLIC